MGIHYGKSDFITYGKPSLFLDFANKKNLKDRISGNNLITFTRSSTGTYVNSVGIITSNAANVPRFEHNPSTGESLGLLIEDSRTNSLKYSNSFSTGGAGNWGSVGAFCVFTQNQTGPDGVSNSAWTIDDQSTAADAAGFEQSVSITPSASTNYCLSIFAKQGTSASFDFYAFFTGTSTKGSYFNYNFSTDTLSATSADGGGITPTIYGKIQYPNGWYRLYFVVNDANSGLNNLLLYRIYPGTRDGGVTGTTLFYGAQLEVGAFPTSYIPTVASTVTRSVDIASITGTNFSEFYNPSEGSVLCNGRIISINPPTFGQIFWAIGDSATFDESVYLVNDHGQTNITFNMFDGGSSVFNTGSSTVTDNSFNKTAVAIKLNDSAGSFNGSTPTTDTSCTLPTVNILRIGNASWAVGAGVNALNGTISQLSYYPRRLTNAQLQQLTQ